MSIPEVYKKVCKKVEDAAVWDGDSHVLVFDGRWRIAPVLEPGFSGPSGALLTEPIAHALIAAHWLAVALRHEHCLELTILPSWAKDGVGPACGFLVVRNGGEKGPEGWGLTVLEALGEYLMAATP